MEREEYRLGFFVHVVEMPALLVETERAGLLITNLGWSDVSEMGGQEVEQPELRGLLNQVLADADLISASGLRIEKHQALLNHVLKRNQLQGWAVPEGLSAQWTDDPGAEGVFGYQVLTRAYYRPRLVDSIWRQESQDGLLRWQRQAFEPFPEGNGRYG